jgi:ArsR family transcriptional regulator
MEDAVSLLQVAADPIRWTVLQRLAGSPSCVCDLQEHVPIAANLLSYHLKVLREAGLVTTSRRGRGIDYTLAENALDRLHAALPATAGEARW